MKLREDGHTGCGVGLCLSRCLRLWWRLQAHRELQLQNLAGGGGYAPGCLAARPSVLRWDPLTWCPSEECCVLGSALGASGGDALAPLGGDGPDRAHRHAGPPGVVSRQVRTAMPSSIVLQNSSWSVLTSWLSCRCSPLHQQHLPALGALHQRHQPGGLQLKARRHAPALVLRLQRGPVERGRGYPRQLPQPL